MCISGYSPHGGSKLIELNAIKTHIELVSIVFNFFVNEYWPILYSIQPKFLALALNFEGFIEMNSLAILLVAVKGLYFEYHRAAQLCR